MAFIADDNRDRKSTRLNSSHVEISYAVFCLKKTNDGTLYLYYTGRKLGVPEPWRNSIGMATSSDGVHFTRASPVHVLDRNRVGFFLNDTATTEIYTLSLHDALPI